MYGKHFASMYTGSMVGIGPTVFALWGYVISNCDREGFVELNPVLLAAILGCSVDEVKHAVQVLTGPDTDSRNKDLEGRRLVQHAAFLYHATTYKKYRDIRDSDHKRTYMRDYMREYRGKANVKNVRPRKGSVKVVGYAPAPAPAPAYATAEDQGQVIGARSTKAAATNEGKASPARPLRGTRLNTDFELPEAWLLWAVDARPGIDAQTEGAKFRDFWCSKSGAGACKLDWLATWRNWIRNAAGPRFNDSDRPAKKPKTVALYEALGKMAERMGNGDSNLVLSTDNARPSIAGPARS